MKFLDLRRLILLLAACSSLLTLAYTVYGAYAAQRTVLIEQTLESNRAYALKLASSTGEFIKSLQQQLSYSARVLALNMHAPWQLAAEAARLKEQDNSFNSVVILDSAGTVLANSPPDLGLLGATLSSSGAKQALRTKLPVISRPYISTTGRLLIFLSHPIVDAQGDYVGLVGGTIYLHERNSLNSLLGEHFYRDGSQIYVIDQDKRLIYHQDRSRIGETVKMNPAINAVTKGEANAMALENSKGIHMLAGYALVKDVQWGVVVQRPTEVVLEGLNSLLARVLRNTIPLFFVVLGLIWLFAIVIAKPLHRLAHTAPNWDAPDAAGRIEKIRAWYFEARHIKQAMLIGLRKLHFKIDVMDLERNTDPLTGLTNRRGMGSALQQWKNAGIPLAVLAADIDHFKKVNDTWGHDVGDQVLRFLADTMRSVTRDTDLICRAGGEEFFLFLPDQSIEQATQLAERLRNLLCNTLSPTGTSITISIGVAHWPAHAPDQAEVLKLADQALYSAKRNGRNRVEISPLPEQTPNNS